MYGIYVPTFTIKNNHSIHVVKYTVRPMDPMGPMGPQHQGTRGRSRRV